MRRLAALLAAALLTVSAVRAQDPEQPPFITTPSEVVLEMLRFAGAGPSDVVADLGSGDGRIVIAAATHFGARGVGIELDPALVEASRRNAQAANVSDRVRFVHGDVLLAEFSQASIVTVYLLPSLINRLQPRFLAELKPGTRIVSHAFAMTGWPPDRSHTVRLSQRHAGQGDQSQLHLWIVPAQARGTWAGGGWEVTVHQNFQQVEVEARKDGHAVPVRDARLSGREISWQAGEERFSGIVADGAIAGRSGGAPLVLQRR